MATAQPRSHTHYIAAFALVAIAAVFVFLSNPGDRITKPALAAPNIAFDWVVDITHGQNPPPNLPPVQFKKIVAKYNNYCILKTNGTVWCWGTLTQKAIAGNTTANPVQIFDSNNSPLTNVVDLDVGCAVKNDGTVWCWGDGAQQDPAPQPNNYTYSPQAVQIMLGPTAPFTHAVKVSAGGSTHEQNCIIKDDGTLWCWGWNPGASTHLGIDANNTVSMYPRQVNDGSGIPGHYLQHVIAVSASYDNICAISSDNAKQLFCWGWNDEGSAGAGNNFGIFNVPNHVADPVVHNNTFAGVTSVMANEWDGCAIDSTKSVACWGMYDPQQIIQPFPWLMAPSWFPYYIRNQNNTVLNNATKVVGWIYDYCTLKGDSSVWCWGYNWAGQLGDGTQVDSLTFPVQARINNLPIGGITDIANGRFNNCAIWQNREVGCWGINNFGALGNGIDPNAPFTAQPVLVTFP